MRLKKLLFSISALGVMMVALASCQKGDKPKDTTTEAPTTTIDQTTTQNPTTTTEAPTTTVVPTTTEVPTTSEATTTTAEVPTTSETPTTSTDNSTPTSTSEATQTTKEPVHTHSYDGYQKSEDGHYQVCECGEKTELTSHTYKEEITKEATYKEAGSKSYTCSICGYSYSLDIPALEKETPTYEVPNLTANALTNASDLVLPDGFTLLEDVSFTEAKTYEIKLSYTVPNDTLERYNTVSDITANVVVSKLTPTITTAPVVNGTYYVGQPFADIELINGVASVPGTFTVSSSGNISTTENELSYVFIPTQDKVYESVSSSFAFAAGYFSVTVTAGENGTATESNNEITYGSDFDITFTPDTYYLVDTVIVDGEEITKTNQVSLTNITKNHTVSVTFKEQQKYTATISKGMCYVYYTYESTEYGYNSPLSSYTGESYTLRIVPVENYYITSFTRNGKEIELSESNTYSFDLLEDIEFVVSTALKPTIKVNGSNISAKLTTQSLSIGNASYFDYGKEDTLTLTADNGYYISSVSLGDTNLSIAKGKEVTIPVTITEDLIYSVTVEKNPEVTIVSSNVSVTPSNATYVNSVYIAEYDASPSFTFTTYENYHIKSVKINDTDVTEVYSALAKKSLEITLDNLSANKTIELEIEIDPYFYIYTSNTVVTIDDVKTIDLVTYFTYDTDHTVTITLNKNYFFESITIDGKDITLTEAEQYGSFTYIAKNMTKNVSIITSVKIIPERVIYLQNSSFVTYETTVGTISSGALYLEYGESLVITATVQNNYYISELTIDGVSVLEKLNALGKSSVSIPFNNLKASTTTISVTQAKNPEIYLYNENSTVETTNYNEKTGSCVYGASPSFTFTPDEGYIIASVYINDVDMTEKYLKSRDTLTISLENVTENVSISVCSIVIPTITVNGSNISVYINDKLVDLNTAIKYTYLEEYSVRIVPNENYYIRSIYHKYYGNPILSVDEQNNGYTITIDSLTQSEEITVSEELCPKLTVKVNCNSSASGKLYLDEDQTVELTKGDHYVPISASYTVYVVPNKDSYVDSYNNAYVACFGVYEATIKNMTSDKEISVTFSLAASITVKETGGAGTTTLNGTSFTKFTYIPTSYLNSTFALEAPEGYFISSATLKYHLKGNDTSVITDNTFTSYKSITYTANYNYIYTFEVTYQAYCKTEIRVNNTTYGSVVLADGEEGSVRYLLPNTKITYSVYANDGYYIESINGNASLSQSERIMVENKYVYSDVSDVVVDVVFRENPTLTFVTDEYSTVKKDSKAITSQKVTYGEEQAFTLSSIDTYRIGKVYYSTADEEKTLYKEYTGFDSSTVEFKYKALKDTTLYIESVHNPKITIECNYKDGITFDSLDNEFEDAYSDIYVPMNSYHYLGFKVKPGYTLSSLTVNGESVEPSEFKLGKVLVDTTIVFTLAMNVYTPTYQKTPQAGVTISLDKSEYHYGDTATLTVLIDEDLYTRGLSSYYVSIIMNKAYTYVGTYYSCTEDFDENRKYSFTVTADFEIQLHDLYKNIDVLTISTGLSNSILLTGECTSDGETVEMTKDSLSFDFTNSYTVKFKITDEYAKYFYISSLTDNQGKEISYTVVDGYVVVSGNNIKDGTIPSKKSYFYININLGYYTADVEVSVVGHGTASSVNFLAGNGWIYDEYEYVTLNASETYNRKIQTKMTMSFVLSLGGQYVSHVYFDGVDYYNTSTTTSYSVTKDTPFDPEITHTLVIHITDQSFYDMSTEVLCNEDIKNDVTAALNDIRVIKGEECTVTVTAPDGMDVYIGNEALGMHKGLSYSFTVTQKETIQVLVRDSLSNAIHVTDDTLVAKMKENPYGYFILDNDITLSSYDYVENFYGILDGKNHTITFNYSTGCRYDSIFIKNAKYAELKNFNAVYDVYYGSNKMGGTVVYTGLILNATLTYLSNIHASGAIRILDTFTCGTSGSILGKGNKVTMYNVTSSVSMTGGKANYCYYGGLAGHLSNNSVVGLSSFTGEISLTNSTTTGYYLGGFAGYAENATIRNSYSEGKLTLIVDSVQTGAGLKVGGFIGNAKSSKLETCYSATDIVLNSQDLYINAGGFVGEASYATLSYCYSIGTITAKGEMNASPNLGGFGAMVSRSTVTECYANEVITITPDSVADGVILKIGGFTQYTYSNQYSLVASGTKAVISPEAVQMAQSSGDIVFGAFAASKDTSSTFESCMACGDITGNSNVTMENITIVTYTGVTVDTTKTILDIGFKDDELVSEEWYEYNGFLLNGLFAEVEAKKFDARILAVTDSVEYENANEILNLYYEYKTMNGGIKGLVEEHNRINPALNSLIELINSRINTTTVSLNSLISIMELYNTIQRFPSDKLSFINTADAKYNYDQIVPTLGSEYSSLINLKSEFTIEELAAMKQLEEIYNSLDETLLGEFMTSYSDEYNNKGIYLQYQYEYVNGLMQAANEEYSKAVETDEAILKLFSDALTSYNNLAYNKIIASDIYVTGAFAEFFANCETLGLI